MGILDDLKSSVVSNINTRLGGNTGTSESLIDALKQRVGNSLYQGARNALRSTDIGNRLLSNKYNHLQAARGRADPLMNNDWFCVLPIINVQGSRGSTIGVSKLGWEMVEEASLPMIELEPESVYRAGRNQHYANHLNLSNLTVKLYEDSEGNVHRYLSDWTDLIVNRSTGMYNFPTDYKKPITFTVFDVAKLEALSLVYKGCWPASCDPLNLTSGSGDRVAPTVTFNVDEVYVFDTKFAPTDLGSLTANLEKDFGRAITNLPNLFPTITTKLFSF